MNILSFARHKLSKEEIEDDRRKLEAERTRLNLFRAEVANEVLEQEKKRYYLALGQTFDLLLRDQELRDLYQSGNPGSVIEALMRACTRNNQTEFLGQIRDRVLTNSL